VQIDKLDRGGNNYVKRTNIVRECIPISFNVSTIFKYVHVPGAIPVNIRTPPTDEQICPGVKNGLSSRGEKRFIVQG